MNALRAYLCVFSYASEKECMYYKRGVALLSALTSHLHFGIKCWNVTIVLFFMDLCVLCP